MNKHGATWLTNVGHAQGNQFGLPHANFPRKISNETVVNNPCHEKRAEKIKRPKKEIKVEKTRALGSLERKAQ